MENIASLMSNLTDAQVTEYRGVKYPPTVQDWARQEAEARIARRAQAEEVLAGQVAQEVAREARKATITKIAKVLEKVWADDLTNVLITREDVDDTEHGEEVKVAGKTEIRYPKVKALVVRTNIYWSEARQVGPTKSGKPKPMGRGITVSKRSATSPNQLELVGNFRNANEACEHLKLVVSKDSATRVLQRDGYFTETYGGTDFTVAK